MNNIIKTLLTKHLTTLNLVVTPTPQQLLDYAQLYLKMRGHNIPSCSAFAAFFNAYPGPKVMWAETQIMKDFTEV